MTSQSHDHTHPLPEKAIDQLRSGKHPLLRKLGISIQFNPAELRALIGAELKGGGAQALSPEELQAVIGRAVVARIKELSALCKRSGVGLDPSGAIHFLPPSAQRMLDEQILKAEGQLRLPPDRSGIHRTLSNVLPLYIPEVGHGLPGHNLLERRIFSLLGVPEPPIAMHYFKDGERHPEVMRDVKGKSILLIPTFHQDRDTRFTEFRLLLSALRRASAGEISVVIPYFPWGRQDRTSGRRVPISAKDMLADELESKDVRLKVIFDIHNTYTEMAFKGGFYNLYSSAVLQPYLSHLLQQDFPEKRVAFVSPDFGSMNRTDKYANLWHTAAERMEARPVQLADIAVIRKTRSGPNQIGSMKLIGSVKNSVVVIPDDLLDTATTVANAARLCMDKGALAVIVAAGHTILSGDGYRTLLEAPIHAVVCTDSIPLPGPVLGNIHRVSCAPLLARAIERMYTDIPLGEQGRGLRDLAHEMIDPSEVLPTVERA